MADLELLAPAGNSALGMAAVDHGADAVYIGAQRFGARASAGNSLADIEALCTYAHFYKARVYGALNTLLFDSELEEARKLIYRLWDAGIDALIIQDMGLLEMDLPPVPLFASTQTDNRTPERVAFLEKNGFSRVILARELSLGDITDIRAATSVELEAFVHGALCVSYSGQCYMSAAIGGRSANRGACGQPCRLPWTLESRDGKVLCQNRHLLSLKDMDRSDHLGDLVKAGITSFKIEGRLKDISYVKNVTGFYRKKLDTLMAGSRDLTPAASGRVFFDFTPDPVKSFSRGRTDYYLLEKGPSPVYAQDSPKSKGEPVGRADRITKEGFILKGGGSIQNGDGLCFVDDGGRLQGFRVNRVGGDGMLYPPGRQPMKKIALKKGMALFRNHDQAFSKVMAGKTAERKIALTLEFYEVPGGVALSGRDEDGVQARAEIAVAPEPANNPDRAEAALRKQLGKLGQSPFYLETLTLDARPLFLPTKDLNGLRRDLIGMLIEMRQKGYERACAPGRPEPFPFGTQELTFRGNVANRAAEAFYRKRGVNVIEKAFELTQGKTGQVMTTRHCIRYSQGHCPRQHGPLPDEWKEPLYLRNDAGRFCVTFDCDRCGMTISNL